MNKHFLLVRVVFLFLLLFDVVMFCHAQKSSFSKEDFAQIQNKGLIDSNEYSYYKREGNDTKFGDNKHKNIVATYNPISLAFKSAMFFYQNVLSPQLYKTCPYTITCSNFGKTSIRKFGLVKGIFLTADRLMRCNRIALLEINPLDIDEHYGTIIDDI